MKIKIHSTCLFCKDFLVKQKKEKDGICIYCKHIHSCLDLNSATNVAIDVTTILENYKEAEEILNKLCKLNYTLIVYGENMEYINQILKLFNITCVSKKLLYKPNNAYIITDLKLLSMNFKSNILEEVKDFKNTKVLQKVFPIKYE